MSRLVVAGNVDENLGVRLPVPYIENIYIDPVDLEAGYTGYRVATAIYLPNPTGKAEELNDFQTLMNEELTLTVFIASDMTEEQYDNVISDKTFIWKDYMDNLETTVDSSSWNTARRAYDNRLSDLERIIEYDEDGNEYVVYRHTVTVSSTHDLWGDDGLESLYVFAVVGMEGIPDATVYATEIANPELYKQKFGEVSYERVWVNGDIADRMQVEYFDDNSNIYNYIPLRTMDSIYVEDNILTHAEIVQYFQELIDEFQTDYERYPRLAKMINSVSYVLETYGNEVNLVPELNKLRKAFPTKSPSNPTGKFYKRFRKRIVTTNDKLKEAKKLHKRVVRNGKIIDLRNPPDMDYPNLNYDSGLSNNYIYPEWYMSRIMDYGNVDYGTDIITHQGVFFFDYERALQMTSRLCQLIEIPKLQEYGIEIPYGAFRVTQIKLEREAENVTITSVMDTGRGYPKTDYCTAIGTGRYEQGEAPLITEGFELSAGLQSSLVSPWYDNPAIIVRNFYNLSQENVGGSYKDNYRLLTCTFQDYYQPNSLDEESQVYKTTVTIEDDTLSLLEVLAGKCQAAYMDFHNYFIHASALGSVNEDTQTFNKFFKDGIIAAYENNMENAPWIVGPLTYCMHLEIVYQAYGSKEAAFNAAYAIIDRVNPSTGTYSGIEQFATEFEIAYQNMYLQTNEDSLRYKAYEDNKWDYKEPIGVEYELEYDFSSLAIASYYGNECNSAADCYGCEDGYYAKCEDYTCECHETENFEVAGQVAGEADSEEVPEETSNEGTDGSNGTDGGNGRTDQPPEIVDTQNEDDDMKETSYGNKY